MGNQMCFPAARIEEHEPVPDQGDLRDEILGTSNLFVQELNEIERNHKYLDELLEQTKKHNLELMKADIASDINLFVLNNLLLCVQFYDNFDSANSAAKAFKQDIENHIAEKLAPLADDGLIHGERRAFLLHGLPHELSKNYIYVDNLDKDKPSHRSKFLRSLSEDGLQNSESIMPLEFIISWDNLEIYKEDEYAKLKEYEYSAAKGAVAINRFCMEEPSPDSNSVWKKKIPRGYVRLRCVDVPLPIKQGHPIVNGSREQEYDYSHLSDFNDAEGVDEVRTDSDVASSEDDEFYTSGDALMRKLQKRLHAWNQPSLNRSGSVIKPGIQANEKFPQTMTKFIAADERRPSGVLPHNYPMYSHQSKKTRDRRDFQLPHSSKSIPPQIQVRRSSTDFPLDFEEDGRNGRSSFLRNMSEDREFLSPPPFNGPQSKLLPAFDIHGKLTMQKATSSGYESMSSAVSYGSSLTSEDIREKWRRTEIKKLWDFPQKRRKSKEPVPESCFFEVLVEIDSEDEDEESPNNSDHNGDSALSRSHSGDSSSDTDTDTPPHLLREPKYDKRTYLDSVAFSSSFCSEFRQIGSQMGLASLSIDKATVVGTTIRSAVIYPAGLQSVEKKGPTRDSFSFLYTFTPSIQSKCSPQLPLTWLLKKSRSDDAKWPQPHHIKSIQSLGSFMIPLGHRSINNTQYENLQQTFEWQVCYAQAENVLLSSFKIVHWRTLLFTSLLFRAFLAPLGPLGIGLEHFRNILYHMCHQEFLSWNDEQPGLHLRALFHKMYVSLARGSMQNFFMRDHNMLKSIPVQNTRMVQAHLKNIQDNMLIHLMYAFHNLKPTRKDFYAMPNLGNLYKIITTRNEQDLIQLVMMTHAFQNKGYINIGSLRGTIGKKKLTKKKRRQTRRQYNMRRAQDADGQLDGGREDDSETKYRRKMLKKYEEFRELKSYHQQQQKEQEEETQKEPRSSMHRSSASKKSSNSNFDLHMGPVKSYSGLRRSLLLKFFIEHFIHMAQKSQQFGAYAQAAMYVLHVENLCEILSSIQTAVGDVHELKNKVAQLREEIGVDHMREYIKAKNSKFSSMDEMMDPLSSISTVPLRPRMHSSNIILGTRPSSRELPDPPRPRLEVPPTNKKMSAPNFVQSLKSLPRASFTEDENLYDPSQNLPQETHMIPRVKDPSSHLLSVKYIDKSTDRKSSESGSVFESTDL